MNTHRTSSSSTSSSSTSTRRLCTVVGLTLALGACGGDEIDALDLADDEQSFRAAPAAYVELDNLMLGTASGYIALDGNALTISTASSWHLRLGDDVSDRDCIKNNDKVYLRNAPVGEDGLHYHPHGLKPLFNHSESWEIQSLAAASGDGCLAPGDSFMLRSNYNDSYLSDDPITLGANEGYEIHDDGAILEYEHITLNIDTQHFDVDALAWIDTSATEWSLRTKDLTTEGCIKAGDNIMVGLQAFPDVDVPKPYYYPPGLNQTAGHSESWRMTEVSIASGDGCLAPGDSFKLLSNRDSSDFGAGERITLEAFDDYAQIEHIPAGVLDFDGVGAAGGTVDVDDQWVSVSLPTSFTDPVVIAGPHSNNGGDASVVRVRNVTSDSFEIRVQEWEYKDGDHAVETISYLVIEAGTHVTDSGVLIEAGTFTAAGGNEERTAAELSAGFTTAPYLFATSQTEDDSRAIAVRVDNLDASGFEVILDEQELFQDGHGDEQIGYLALGDTPADTATQANLLTTADVATDWVEVAGVELKMQEERSWDYENSHNPERLNVMSLTLADEELVFAQDFDYLGSDTAAIRWRAL